MLSHGAKFRRCRARALGAELVADNDRAYLRGEAPVADRALERSLLRVAAVVDLQRRIARESLEADVARGVAAHCNRSCDDLVILNTGDSGVLYRASLGACVSPFNY